jgi:hypothetical protein
MRKGPEKLQGQFGTADILLATAAVGLWVIAVLKVKSSRIDPALIVIALSGITVAVHRLLRPRPHAWPTAAVLAPIIAGLCLMVAAVFSNYS